MGVPFGSKVCVVEFAPGVVLRADSGPMVHGISEPLVARFSHQDRLPLAATPRDRRDACIAAKSVIVSFCESLRGFREHRGGDTPTDSRQGTKEVDVTMPDYLLVRADLVQYRINAAGQLLPQIVVETKLR